MLDYTMYPNKSYSELETEYDRLEEKYDEIEKECLKDNLSYDAFCKKAHDVKEKMFMVDKAAGRL